MDLIFRKVDETNPKDILAFDELMDDITERAFDDQLLIEKIGAFNRREDAYLLVAEDRESGRLVGSLMGVMFSDFCGLCAPVMVIENVVTHHDFRRKGVARAMMNEIEEWGRARGVRYATLCSAMTRTEAHRMYAALGYGEVKGYKKYL